VGIIWRRGDCERQLREELKLGFPSVVGLKEMGDQGERGRLSSRRTAVGGGETETAKKKKI